MNSIKTKIHAALFPNMAATITEQADMLAQQATARAEDAALIERMGEELDHEHQAKKDAWIAIGHYRTQIQSLQFLDRIQKTVIQTLSTRAAEASAEAGKYKSAALEIEEELKSSFFEIADLNKRLDEMSDGVESGAQDGARGAEVVPMLARSA